MHQSQRRFHARIPQILEIVSKLGRQQHALINQGAAGERNGIKSVGALIFQSVNMRRDHLTQNVQVPLEVIL